MENGTSAAIVGGGIGGIATAIALRNAGLDPRIYERAADVKAIQLGAGLFFWPNAIRAARLLGLEDGLRSIGRPIEYFELRSWRRGLLSRWPVGEIGRRLEAVPLTVTRPEVHQVLIDAAAGGSLLLGCEYTSFEQDERRVTVTFADGREECADVLVGADGLHSLVRAQLLGPAEARWTGYTAWRAIVPVPEFTMAETVTVHWGPGARLVTYRLTGERSYWLALANAAEGGEDSPAGRKSDVLAAYEGWPAPLLAMISATDESAIHRMDIYDRPPIDHWSHGRVTLMGDAAHPTTPNLAQGAAYALEDAVVLGKAMRETSNVADALTAYEAKRVKRAAAMVKNSFRMGTLARWKQPLAVAARDRLISTVTSRSRFVSQLERDLAVDL